MKWKRKGRKRGGGKIFSFLDVLTPQFLYLPSLLSFVYERIQERRGQTSLAKEVRKLRGPIKKTLTFSVKENVPTAPRRWMKSCNRSSSLKRKRHSEDLPAITNDFLFHLRPRAVGRFFFFLRNKKEPNKDKELIVRSLRTVVFYLFFLLLHLFSHSPFSLMKDVA